MHKDIKITKQKVEEILKTIPDPELGVSIWDLGLIYNVRIKERKVEILMTLTTMGCPLFSQIAEPIESELKKCKGVESVFIELTFEPPWTPEKMTDEARVQLGL